MRVVARFLDGLILVVIDFALAWIVIGRHNSAGFDGIGGDASFTDLYVAALIGVVTTFVWDAVMTRMFGGTPMKLVFGMRVVRSDNGQPVEWNHAITRWAIPGAFHAGSAAEAHRAVSAGGWIISLVFIFSKPLRQAVWDQVAKTLVVRRAG